MASCFTKVLEDDISATNEAAVPKIPKKRRNLTCWCLSEGRQLFSHQICYRIKQLKIKTIKAFLPKV